MKKIVTFLSLFMLASTSFAFTLTSEKPHKFTNQKVLINFNNESCANVGVSSERLFNLVVKAVDRTWNTVNDVRIKLVKGVTTNAPHEETVLVSCVDSIFVDGQSAGGIEGKHHYVKISTWRLANLDYSTDENLMTSISHSFGHALGLGHSGVLDAHMSFRSQNPELTDDDRAGYQYLYGRK